ncbi:unnamed protein product [Pleuronectes platessa]|uniref:Uncharacterized protein n=1 Tax=Pleuronectes platessa TaxID=8262 RepID=A0A9N7VLI0_PLEPL|nr:unnamed protein product [Pleuronectes platessa]
MDPKSLTRISWRGRGARNSHARRVFGTRRERDEFSLLGSKPAKFSGSRWLDAHSKEVRARWRGQEMPEVMGPASRSLRDPPRPRHLTAGASITPPYHRPHQDALKSHQNTRQGSGTSRLRPGAKRSLAPLHNHPARRVMMKQPRHTIRFLLITCTQRRTSTGFDSLVLVEQ